MRKNQQNELPKIRVIIRDDKTINSEGKYTLNYAIRFQGRTIKKASGLYVKPNEWNKKKACTSGTSKEILRIQGLLSNKLSDFNQYFLGFDSTGGRISRKVIDDYFQDRRFDDFLSYFKGVIDKRTDLATVTKNKYLIALKTLKAYCRKEKIKPVQFRTVDLAFLKSFDLYLIKFKKVSSDTANNYHKCLKYALNQAILDGIIDRTPYFGFKPIKTSSRKKVLPLTLEEVFKIESVAIPAYQSHLESIRDYFLFMLNTGVRYSDMFRLCIENIIPEYDSSEFMKRELSLLHFTQKKTGNPTTVPLNRTAKLLISKYYEFYQLEEGLIFPSISNQVFNRHLKDLAILADLKRGLNCHLARHSFATNLRNMNVPLDDVSELLGHSSVKMTKIYAKSNMDNLLTAVQKLNAH